MFMNNGKTTTVSRYIQLMCVGFLSFALMSCFPSSLGSLPTPLPTVTPHPMAITPNNVSQVEEIARYGDGRLTDITWSSDSQTLMFFTAIGIYEYDARNLSFLDFRPMALGTGTLAIHSGRNLAATIVTTEAVRIDTLEKQDTIRLWDINKGQPVREFHGVWAFDLAFSPNGTYLAAAGWKTQGKGGLVQIWDVNDGHLVTMLEGDRRWSVDKITFSPDSRILAAAGRNETQSATLVRLWDIETGSLVFSVEGKGESLTFSPDEKVLQLGNGRWDIASGKSLESLGDRYPWDFAISPAGHWEADVGPGSNGSPFTTTVQLWNMENSQLHWTSTISNSGSKKLAFSPDSQMLVIFSDYGEIKVWDVPSGQELGSLQWLDSSIESLAISPTGIIAAWSDINRRLQIWDLAQEQQLRVLENDIDVVAYSPGGQLGGCNWKTCFLWDETGNKQLRELPGQEYPDGGLAFSPDGRILVGTNNGVDVTVWDLSTGKQMPPLKGHTSSVISVDFSQDGHFFATASNDATVRIWDSHTFELSRTLTTIDRIDFSAFGVAVSPDNQTVAGSTSDGMVWLWNVNDGQLLHKFTTDHPLRVRSVAFSPDGRLLASAGDDGLIYLWDPLSGQTLQILRNHTSGVTTLAFTPDGRWLVSGSWDGTVRVWGIKQ
ncbi:MAG: WD40 repeat domain-containing protein [Anaerolineae bacterium]